MKKSEIQKSITEVEKTLKMLKEELLKAPDPQPTIINEADIDALVKEAVALKNGETKEFTLYPGISVVLTVDWQDSCDTFCVMGIDNIKVKDYKKYPWAGTLHGIVQESLQEDMQSWNYDALLPQVCNDWLSSYDARAESLVKTCRGYDGDSPVGSFFETWIRPRADKEVYG